MNEEQLIKNESAVMITGNHRSEVYEKRTEFDNSLFRRVYKRAYSIVQENVDIQLEKDRSRGTEENIDNVITFMGRRGTGKSSAMHSFMKALLDNDKDDRMLDEYTVRNKENVGEEKIKFIGIDWIDASLLEQGENIFEAILAKMLNELIEKNDGQDHNSYLYDLKSLYNEFASIYKKHLNLKQRTLNDSYSMESAIADLRDLSRSSDIRGRFQELIKKYIHIKSYCGDKYQMERRYETFLVVAIDDIDMNIDSGFEILEKLQRYLKVERLIILIAVNYEQMKLCCEKHFAKVFDNNIYEKNKRKEYVGSLADQYLEKVLPSYARVYLPSLKKMDYDRNRITNVKIRDKNGKEAVYPIKKAMFIMAWNKTMVRYDAEGLKRHFMEPESLRELNNLGIFRNFMPDLQEDSDDFLEMLDFNYKRSMDDLLFRYADEKLPEKEGDIFISLSERDIRRRGIEIVSLFLEAADKQYSEARYCRIAERLQEGYKKFQYSYGELLHSIYCIGRLPAYDKKLVHAILAMYTLTLTKIYYRYKKSIKQISDVKRGILEVSEYRNNKICILRQRNYDMMKELIEKSVGGSWSRLIMPICVVDNRKYYCGAVKRVNLDVIKFKMNLSLNNQIAELKKNVGVQLDEKKTEECYEKFSDMILDMKWDFILTLFLVCEEGYKIKDPTDKREVSVQKNNRLPFGNASAPYGHLELEGFGEYNVMNFVNNSFLFDDRLNEFVNALCNMVGTFESELEHEKIIEKLITRDGFYKNMHEWTVKYGGMVVPVYSMDIYYNMFKRLARTQQLSNEREINLSDLYKSFHKLLQEIEKHLNANDEYYGSRDFTESFAQCPFVKEMRFDEEGMGEEIKKERIEQFNNFLDKIIRHSSNEIETYDEEFARITYM